MAEGATGRWLYPTSQDGNRDYTVVDPRDVRRILELLGPYVRLKAEHVSLSLEILEEFPLDNDPAKLILVSRLVDRFQKLNYSKKRTGTSFVVIEHLQSHGFHAPVETDPLRRESPDPTAANTPVPSVAS